MKKDIKIISLDLDGTLLDSQKRLSEENRAALEEAAAKGVHIVPTTGRFFGMMPQAIRDLPFVRYAITINGAQVYDRKTDAAIVREEIEKMEQVPWQYFVAIPDVKSTGIKDGKRYMGWAAVIRAINTVDAVTAESVEIPWEMLCRMRDRIIAEVPGVNRVLWDVSDKPTSTIEWE
jgi:GMP synthase (glutamine-hydrolysing)